MMAFCDVDNIFTSNKYNTKFLQLFSLALYVKNKLHILSQSITHPVGSRSMFPIWGLLNLIF